MTTADQLHAIRQLVKTIYFGWRDEEYFATPGGEVELYEQVESRSATARNHVVPWLSRIFTFPGKRIVEFGSGTGAISSVLAQHGAHVHGYEIQELAVATAKGRAEILGLPHCQFSHVSPEAIPETAERDWADQADIALFYAVLEHTTYDESLALLRSAWRCLKPGGLLVVTDTPNRLSYFDYHTSHMPFFNNMGDEMVATEAWRSPRDNFRSDFHNKGMDSTQREMLVRWGRGTSFHAFETAIGPEIHNQIVLTGYEPEMVSAWPVMLEDAMLLSYFKAKPIPAHDAFARTALNLAIRKPV